MHKAVFLLSYPLIWLVSRLPLPLLYGLSNGVYFLVYHLVGYRRKVVRDNLRLVFPEVPEKRRREIERKFYRHLCDMFLEMAKTMGMKPEQIMKRFTFSNLELIRRLEDEGKSMMIVFPHYASWEWAIILDRHIRSRGFGIYQPINNPYFDRWVRDVRGKFGMTLITTKQTRDVVAQNRKEGQLATYGILIDQSPMLKKAHYWAPFMGIEVPIHTGAEMLCKQLDLPVVYLKVTKLGRGRYHGECILLAEEPTKVPDYAITDAFFRETEKAIREAPEYYFWTHKRWKHRGKKPAK
ncbi:lysophospholipid acyltransferase family protein [Robiginitalea sediminis]|uniref:lysophospholipid acyltransferase family protein n=1 Tax=Robiginitalea sediminis TaxID=1982593 RepID=UPI000B4BB6E4|nr:lysophospholipid acyltransferase family protein [Robiginitalea sediminis]